MTGQTIAYLMAGAVAGGFINGLSGTGTALFALGFFLVVLEPVTAVAVVALMSILSGLQGLWVVRAAIRARPGRTLRFVIPGLIGVPFGVALLASIDAGTLRIAIALFLIIYGAWFTFRRALPRFEKPTAALDVAVGGIGGVLGGAASVSGALPAMWLSIRPWAKAETRAVLQPFNIAILGTTVALLFLRGSYDATAVMALAVAVPTGLVAAQVGIFVFHRLSDDGFRRLLIGLTLVMGIGILAQEVLL
ncbi:MAG: sulfite exporter TauE/SafE family protein [Jannaschia sp.]